MSKGVNTYLLYKNIKYIYYKTTFKNKKQFTIYIINKYHHLDNINNIFYKYIL